MSRFLRVCAFLFVSLLSTNLFAAGYTCSTKAYTSCNEGYYMATSATNTTYNGTPAAGNACLACPDDAVSCPGGTDAPVYEIRATKGTTAISTLGYYSVSAGFCTDAENCKTGGSSVVTAFTSLPTKSGYTFDGFYDTSGDTQHVTPNGVIVPNASSLSGPQTWYSYWTRCPAGYYCDGSTPTAKVACPSGWQSDAGATSQFECYKTFVLNTNGATFATDAWSALGLPANHPTFAQVTYDTATSKFQVRVPYNTAGVRFVIPDSRTEPTGYTLSGGLGTASTCTAGPTETDFIDGASWVYNIFSLAQNRTHGSTIYMCRTPKCIPHPVIMSTTGQRVYWLYMKTGEAYLYVDANCSVSYDTSHVSTLLSNVNNRIDTSQYQIAGFYLGVAPLTDGYRYPATTNPISADYLATDNYSTLPARGRLYLLNSAGNYAATPSLPIAMPGDATDSPILVWLIRKPTSSYTTLTELPDTRGAITGTVGNPSGRFVYTTTCPDGYALTGTSGTYSASCSQSYFSVNYDGNGNTGGTSPSSPAQCIAGHSTCKAPANTYTKTGYTFAGWACTGGNESCDGDIISADASIGALASPGSTIVLTAQWTPNVTGAIALDSKYYATSSTPTGMAVTTNAAPSTVYIKYNTGWYSNSTATTPIIKLSAIPAYAGYDFGGFYTGKAGTGTQMVDASGNFTAASKTQYPTAGATATWYAHWTPKQFTASYSCGSGTGTPPSDATATYNSNFTLDDNTCSRVGYTFNGWSDGTTTREDGETFTWTYTTDKTFSAVWEPNPFSVTFKSGNTTLGTQDFVYGKAQNLTSIANLSNIPVSDEWTFVGWSTSVNTTTPTYADGQPVYSLTEAANGNVVLYAIWERNVSFKYYDGASATATTTNTRTQYYRNTSGTAAGVTGVSTYALATQSTYNWAPVGWVLNSTAGTTTASTATTTTGTVTPALGSTNPTYYALYSRTATVAYSGNGSTGGSTSNTTGTQYFNAGSTNANALNLTLANNGFSKTGYTFNKWAAGSTSGTQYASGATLAFPNKVWASASTYTMYANWTPNTYSITYNLNGGSHGASHPEGVTYNTQFTVNNPTHAHGTFAGWKITGMDGVTHTYGSSTTTATSISSTTATTFKNLRSTSGTVTFTALWTCATGYTTGDNCTANNYTITLNKNNTGANDTATGSTTLYTTYNTNVYNDSNRTKAMTTSTNGFTAPKRAFTVTFNANGGTVNTTSATATSTFKGYYSAATGGTQYTTAYTDTGTQYILADGLTAGKGYTSNKTWYAQWTAGSVKLPIPTRTGYDFAGWSTDDDATSGTTGSYTPTASVTLYATWAPKQFTITLDKYNTGANDTATGSTELYTRYDAGAYIDSDRNKLMSTSANPLTIPKRAFTVSFSATGATVASRTATSTFKGYIALLNAGESPVGVVNENGYIITDGINAAKGYTSDQTWSAKWQVGTITLPTATKTGYTVTEWYTDSALTTSAGEPGATYTPSASVTLYGKWTPNLTGAIALDSKYYATSSTPTGMAVTTNAAPSTVYIKYNTGWYSNSTATTPIIKLSAIPAYAGYDFGGFYTGKAGTGTQMVDASGNFTVASKTQYGSAGATATWYAHWIPDGATPFVVNHYTQNLGATTYTLHSTENKTGTTGASITLASYKKTISGFTYLEGFAGTSATGTTKPSSGAVTSTTILASGTRVINLYYNRTQYSFTVSKNGGTGSLTVGGVTATGTNSVTVTCSYGDSIVLPGWSGTKANNIFTGWSSETPVTCNSSINGTTITAQWGEATCTINGGGEATVTKTITNNKVICTCTSKAGSYCTKTTTGDYGVPNVTVTVKKAPNGSYALAGATAPTECATGSYSTQSLGSSSCTPCQNGYTTSGKGTGYSENGSTACTVACSNNTSDSNGNPKVYQWKTATWSANKVTDACTIDTCASTYVLTGDEDEDPSTYVCSKCECIWGTGVNSCDVTGTNESNQCEYSYTCQSGYGNWIDDNNIIISFGSAGVAQNRMTCEANKQTVQLDSKYYKNSTTTITPATVADPSTLYFRFNDGVYSDSYYTNKITALTAVPHMENTCYAFRGFYSGPRGGGMQYINADGEIVVDLTVPENMQTIYGDGQLYAHYEPTHMNLKYDPGAGSLSGLTVIGRVCPYTGTGATGSCKLETHDDSFNFVAPVGHSFAGWKCTGGNASCDGDILQPGADVIDVLDGDCGTITLTAQWEPNPYKVTFKSGNTTLGTQDFIYDTAQNLTSIANLSNIPVSDEWIFVGWSTYATGTTAPAFTNGQRVSKLTETANGNVVLYAIWRRNVLFKYYDSASATATTTNTRTQYYRNTSSIAAGVTGVSTYALATQSTYNWAPVGWVLNSTTDTTTASTATTTTGTVTPALVSANPTYYALYSRTATVTYNGNGNTGGSTSDTTGTQYFNAGSDAANTLFLTLADNGFTKTGYTFNEWAMGSATGTKLEPGNTVRFMNELWDSADTYPMYADWTPNTNTAFVVNHYTKKLGATTYTLYSTEHKTGTTAASITLASYKMTITGFTYVEGFADTTATGTTKPSSGAVTSTTILADGTRVINLYYDRVITTITVSKNNGSGSLTVNGTTTTGTTNVSFTCEYGATFTLPAWNGSANDLALTKKVFTGWDKTGTITCGTANQTITAQWLTPTCIAGTGVNTTSLKEVTDNAPVCNRSSECGFYCSATETGSAGATSLTTTCTKTDPGYYAAAGATEQKAADAGYYATEGACEQTPCGDGKWSAGATATCSLIDEGCYGTNGTKSCPAQCVTGSYTATKGQSECVACQSGTTTSGRGKTSCDATCANNNSYDVAWETASWSANSMTNLCVISKCGAGSKYASANGGSCTACGLGTYQSSTSHTNTTCSPAGSGYYVATEGASSQSACASWRANTNTNGATGSTSTSACVCKSGMYLNSSNACEECAEGTYKSANSNAACTLASLNYYVDGTGNTSQSACSTLGSFYTKTQSTGSTSDKCYGTTTAGNYIATPKAGQVTCACGGYCLGNTKVYYNTTGGRDTCDAGTYNTATGASAESSCKAADAGYYVQDAGMCNQTECTGATYNNTTGQAICKTCPTATNNASKATNYSYWNSGKTGDHTTVTGCYVHYENEDLDDGSMSLYYCYADTDAATTGEYGVDGTSKGCWVYWEKLKCDGGYYNKNYSTSSNYDFTNKTIANLKNNACTAVESDYWSANDALTRTACDTGLVTCGSGKCANEADDCGRKLHAGDDVIYLRSAVRTNPSLRVKVGETTFYGALSTSLSNSLKVKKDGTEYSVVNDYQ